MYLVSTSSSDDSSASRTLTSRGIFSSVMASSFIKSTAVSGVAGALVVAFAFMGFKGEPFSTVVYGFIVNNFSAYVYGVDYKGVVLKSKE